MLKIYIDADGCPVKEEVYQVAERYKMPVVLVANRKLNLPPNPLLEMKVVPGDFDAADNWIADHAQVHDVVVTGDVLLAERCVKKAVRAVSLKGEEFTDDNIGTAISNRELMHNLRHMGEMRGPAPMVQEDRSRFSHTLDQILQDLKQQGLL